MLHGAQPGARAPPKYTGRWFEEITEKLPSNWVFFTMESPLLTIVFFLQLHLPPPRSPFTGTVTKKAGSLAPWLSAPALQQHSRMVFTLFPWHHFFSTPRYANSGAPGCHAAAQVIRVPLVGCDGEAAVARLERAVRN